MKADRFIEMCSNPSTDAEIVEASGLRGSSPAIVWANTWASALPTRTAWAAFFDADVRWRSVLSVPGEVTPQRWYAELRYQAVRAGILDDVHRFLLSVLQHELASVTKYKPE